VGVECKLDWGVVVVVAWVRLNLNPAFWETIAATGVVVVVVWVRIRLNTHPQKPRVGHPRVTLVSDERRLVADAAFDGGVAFAGVDDDFLFFAFLVVDD
jgi:hypothetical protein